ncbi:hypothetical protein HOK68_01905 [Candidatus Woesearchaeota archaeon]|nr:hypothetical protein [Candidatus Woesearchaeota archaeon]MBT4387597.1 hypothetical protein [Candidatus Woesearchaeota archaeon]MBT4596041.1 hypothetical protein [Candidatus Woesearchaeota archaeon]MBT5740749.1 hypothetical protein [Candidatus Woesearchaeota archaeon]MBT6505515.1 hypothetical protein [Candidatus Woesearchaeota archaeon]
MKNQTLFQNVKSLLNTISKFFVNDIGNNISKKINNMNENLQNQFNIFMNSLMRQLMIFLFSIITFIFLLTSGTFYLIEYHNLNYTISFFYIGIILILITFFLHHNNLKRQLEVQNGKKNK